MGKVDWRWGPPEALSFTVLREQAVSKAELHGAYLDQPVEMYVDASQFAGVCFIRQRQNSVPVPVLYDSFLFTKTQRNYGTYKWELCTMVEFCRRHRHYFCTRERSTVFTDHKPLTWFLKGSEHEGIFARWVTKLRVLNFTIQNIEGRMNIVADTLSRTVFDGDGCKLTCEVVADQFGSFDPTEGLWKWKDGNDGFERFLGWLRRDDDVGPPVDRTGRQLPELTDDQWAKLRASWKWNPTSIRATSSELTADKEAPDDRLTDLFNCDWYEDVMFWLTESRTRDDSDRHLRRKIVNKARNYRWSSKNLWKRHQQLWVRGLLPEERSKALELAHDKAGHFSAELTRRRLATHVCICLG